MSVQQYLDCLQCNQWIESNHENIGPLALQTKFQECSTKFGRGHSMPFWKGYS